MPKTLLLHMMQLYENSSEHTCVLSTFMERTFQFTSDEQYVFVKYLQKIASSDKNMCKLWQVILPYFQKGVTVSLILTSCHYSKK